MAIDFRAMSDLPIPREVCLQLVTTRPRGFWASRDTLTIFYKHGSLVSIYLDLLCARVFLFRYDLFFLGVFSRLIRFAVTKVGESVGEVRVCPEFSCVYFATLWARFARDGRRAFSC